MIPIRMIALCAVYSILQNAGAPAARIVRVEAMINASPADVWNALTTKSGVESWMAPSAEIDLRPGGAIRVQADPKLKIGDPGTKTRKILCFEPLRMLALQYEPAPDDPDVLQQWGKAWQVVRLAPGGPNPPESNQTNISYNGVGIPAGKDGDELARTTELAFHQNVGRLQNKFNDSPRAQKSESAPASRSLAQDYIVDANVRDAWEAFTTKAGAQTWMMPLVEVDFRLGGTLKTHYDKNAKIGDFGTTVQHILAYEPLQMVAMQFEIPPTALDFLQLAGKTWWVARFDALNDRQTRVSMSQVGFGEGETWDKAYKYFELGNDVIMKQLQKRFANSREAPASNPAPPGK